MKFLKLANMSEILGTMTIVGSLVFVGWQIHQSDQIARAEIEAAQGIMSIELAALISDHSDVWARGVAQEDLNDADSVVFENLVSALNDARFSVFLQIQENDNIESAMGYIHDFSGFPKDDQFTQRKTLQTGKWSLALVPLLIPAETNDTFL